MGRAGGSSVVAILLGDVFGENKASEITNRYRINVKIACMLVDLHDCYRIIGLLYAFTNKIHNNFNFTITHDRLVQIMHVNVL